MRGVGTGRPRGLVWRVIQEVRPRWPHLLGLLVLNLAAAPTLLLVPVPLKIAIDSVLGGHRPPPPLSAVLPEALAHGFPLLVLVGIGQVLVVVLAQGQQMLADVLSARVGERLTLNFRTCLFAHVQRLSLHFHDTRGTSESVFRIQYDAPALKQVVVDGALPFAGSAVSLGAMVYVTARLSWELAAVAVVVCPVVFLMARAYHRTMRSRYRRARQLESEALRVVHEALGALRVVLAFGREELERRRFVDEAATGAHARTRLALTEGLLSIAVNGVVAAGMAGVLVLGVVNVRSGRLTLGELMMVMTYLAQLYRPLTAMSKKVADVQSAIAGLERAFELLDQAPEVAERRRPRSLRQARGEVEFVEVSFAHGAGELLALFDGQNTEAGDRRAAHIAVRALESQLALHDVSFHLRPGERLGISGHTGAGKTTLATLLMRFHDPLRGGILLDGVDLREYRLRDLRDQIALVLQEPVLFSRSVAENVGYGRREATFEQIRSAAEAADAHDFISRLPQGYDTPLGERGLRLSGGERQRIAIARAFLKDAPILVLDEPTSSVDIHTEERIMGAIEQLMAGRTTIVIAHRLSTLKSCDVRLELTGGRVAGLERRPPATAARGWVPL